MLKKSMLLFITLSVFASFLNYVIYPFFSRILSPSEYVHITSSLSLFTQISTFLSSILAITIGLSKEDGAKGSHAKVELLQSFLFKLFFFLSIIFLAMSPVIMQNIHSPTLFAFPICFMMVLSIPITVVSGYLNGKNAITKLGTVIAISATDQFVIGLLVALLTHDGLMTMLSMSLAQILTLIIIYATMASEKLPSIKNSLLLRIRANKDQKMTRLLIYTAFASFAIMAISLIQIIDLFLLQSLHGADVKFYTDIYVVSRVVFFAGMILIWPFLGEISLDHHHFNRRPFIKLSLFFGAITLGAIVMLTVFGSDITRLLFGAHYSPEAVRTVGTLSVLYRLWMLIITAVILYFAVLRSYVAVYLSFAMTIVMGILIEMLNKSQSISFVLWLINGIAIVFAIIGTLLLFRVPIKQPRSKQSA